VVIPPAGVVRDRDRYGLPVVVGVDGSVRAALTVRVALNEASLHRVAVVAVHCRRPDGQATLDADEQLGSRLVGCATHYPDVDFRYEVSDTAPERRLCEASGTASLLALGGREHRTLRRAVLGSTSLAVMRNAACPVLVVPPHTAGQR
jgi:nucleotide-binding universal stress UspA family protein